MRRRSWIGSQSTVGLPLTITSPEVGSIKRLINLMVVVLPEPLRPSSTRVSPRSTCKLRWANSVLPLDSAKLTSRNSMAISSGFIKNRTIYFPLTARYFVTPVETGGHPYEENLDTGFRRHDG